MVVEGFHQSMIEMCKDIDAVIDQDIIDRINEIDNM